MPQLTLEFLAQQARQEAPVEPDGLQRQLTGRILQPKRAALAEDLLRLRGEFDREFLKGDHPRVAKYPISCCLEITKGLLPLIRRELEAPATPGFQALHQFLAAGGLVKRIWGNLRDQYFQNALQMGSLYVDVANDTVDRNKPKIEILPLHQSGFKPLTNYLDYGEIAERYWNARVYPNRYVAEIAPLFPLIVVYDSGRLQFHSQYQNLLYQNLLSNFVLAEQAILQSPWRDRLLPDGERSLLRELMSAQGLATANAPLSALDDASLQNCFQQARTSGLQLDGERCQVMLNWARRFQQG